MKRKKILDDMGFMNTLNDVANSCAPKKNIPQDIESDTSSSSQPVTFPTDTSQADSELPPNTLTSFASTSDSEEMEDSKGTNEIHEAVNNNLQISSIQQSTIEESPNADDTPTASPKDIDEPITNESMTSTPTPKKRTYKKRVSKKQVEDGIRKIPPLQTIEEIENLTIFQRIKRVSAKTAKCSLFTTVWVLKEKLDHLKLLYPKKGIMYILDELITDHLIEHKAKLQAAARKKYKHLR